MRSLLRKAVGGYDRCLGPARCVQVEYLKGWGTIKSPNEVVVAAADGTSKSVKTKNIVLATGSEVTPLPGVPIDEEK